MRVFRIIYVNEVHYAMTDRILTGSQLDKFKKAAREHGADEDEARWDGRLKKIAKAKPAPEKPE